MGGGGGQGRELGSMGGGVGGVRELGSMGVEDMTGLEKKISSMYPEQLLPPTPQKNKKATNSNKNRHIIIR